MRDAGGGPSSAPTPPASRIPLPDEPPSRNATTVNNAPNAPPATLQGSPARHPDDWAPPTCAPHL